MTKNSHEPDPSVIEIDDAVQLVRQAVENIRGRDDITPLMKRRLIGRAEERVYGLLRDIIEAQL